jgi:hypothetical protein
MKKQFLIIALIMITSIVSFGQRVLTEDERQSLLINTVFNEKCKMAIRDYAAFWAVDPGSGATTEALKIKWAKDRIKSVGILLEGVNDDRVSEIFINSSKGKQLTLGTAPLPAATIIAAWDTNNTFAEFAGAYFDVISTDLIFKIGN